MHQTLCLLKDSFYISITTLQLFAYLSIIIDILSKCSLDKFLYCDWIASIYSLVGTIKLKILAKFTRSFASEKICQMACSRVHLDLFACVIFNASLQCCGNCFFCCFIVGIDNPLFLSFTDTQKRHLEILHWRRFQSQPNKSRGVQLSPIPGHLC